METPAQHITDNELITLATSGNRAAMDQLIKRHQEWIFNTAIAFVADREEALDMTQEVLIKVVTHLSTFKQESQFQTWLYRIIKNHFLNRKRGKYEVTTTSFDEFGKGLDNLPDETLTYRNEAEEKMVVKEAQISCMRGMLLCLDREQRLIFILGELFEFPDTIGSQIMEMSKENFRVKLHRAKQQLYGFMDNKCGLINKKNPCRCARKTASFIKLGCVDPVQLHFQQNKIAAINKMLEKKLSDLDQGVTTAYQKLYQEIPFLQFPESVVLIREWLTSDVVKETFNVE